MLTPRMKGGFWVWRLKTTILMTLGEEIMVLPGIVYYFMLQNIKEGPEPDASGVIFRINPNDGSPSVNNPFIGLNGSGSNPFAKYYPYGIRNSFGFDFNPITAKLWDAENGQDLYDEINLVEVGFNSGWKQLMGPISSSG